MLKGQFGRQHTVAQEEAKPNIGETLYDINLKKELGVEYLNSIDH